MSLAAQMANKTARNHGRDPWKVAARLRLRVKRASLPSPHRELYVQRHRPRPVAGLAIANNANAEEERELLAHGIGHHLMHAGDRVTGTSRAVWSGSHEKQAEDFAALLLIPRYQLRQLEGREPKKDVAELAERCQVSERLARRRLRLA